MATALWAFFSACCTWHMAFTFISPISAGMKREPRTVPSAGSRDPRERAPRNHVDAGSLACPVVHGDARRAGDDGRKSYDAHPHAPGSRLHLGDQIISEQSATDNLFADCDRQEGFYFVYQPAGENHSADK